LGHGLTVDLFESLLLKQLDSIVHIAVVGPLLLVLELDGVLAVLSEELANAISIVASDLMVVGEA